MAFSFRQLTWEMVLLDKIHNCQMMHVDAREQRGPVFQLVVVQVATLTFRRLHRSETSLLRRIPIEQSTFRSLYMLPVSFPPHI